LCPWWYWQAASVPESNERPTAIAIDGFNFAKSKCAGRLYSPRISTRLKIIPLCSQSGSNELEMQLETNRSSSSFYAKALKCGIIAPSILPGNNNGEQK